MRVLRDEINVEYAFAVLLRRIVRIEDMLAHAGNGGNITAIADLMILAAHFGALVCQHLRHILRIDKGFEAAFAHRIECHDLGTALYGVLQRMEETWRVATGILAEKEKSFGLLKILPDHGTHRLSLI